MKRNLLCIALLVYFNNMLAQNVAINNDGNMPHASAMLDVKSTSKGLLIPRMTTLQRSAISSPAVGLLVYDTDAGSFFYYNGMEWGAVSGNSNGWKVNGNSGTDPSTNFVGTSDNQSLLFKVNSQPHGWLQVNGSIFWGRSAGNSNTAYSNIGIGTQALFSNTNRGNLIAIGDSALMNNGTGASTAVHARYNTAIGSKALYENTTGYSNTALGFHTLMNNTAGYQNLAIGVSALNANNNGYRNIAIGSNALFSNTSSFNNTAIGNDALESNTTGNNNIAIGDGALHANTTANSNIAIGSYSLMNNSTGFENIAIGENTLKLNTTGKYNIGIGKQALQSNTTGDNNVAIGYSAAYLNTTASHNTAIGHRAMYYTSIGDSNTVVGSSALRDNVVGSSNTAVGSQTLANSTGSMNTALGTRALYLLLGSQKNTAIGYKSLEQSTGPANTAVGCYSSYYTTTAIGTTAIGYAANANNHDWSTAIGNNATNTSSNQIMLGDTYIDQVAAYGPFIVLSDKRFKQNIQHDVHGLDFIMKLKPVTYHYDMNKLTGFLRNDKIATTKENFENEEKIQNERRLKKEAIKHTGFLAQDVEEAAKEAGYDFSGIKKPQHDKDHYGIAYSDFVVPLVKAVQEQQKMIEDLKKQVEDLKKLISTIK